MELNQEIVKELLDYNPETGILTWKERDIKWFKKTSKRSPEWKANNWNSKNAGNQAFTSENSFGHKEGRIFGNHFLSHRIIFLWMYGRWPVGIDHLNRIPNDNRIVNIQECTQEVNMKNKGLQSNNKTGKAGIRLTKNGKYRATINVNKNTKHLGYFASFNEACRIREKAETEYGYKGLIIHD